MSRPCSLYGGLVGTIATPSADVSAPPGREPGPLTFARFALPPNRLGYCGGDEAASLLQHVDAGVVDEDLLRQCRDFEGAYPYLRLVAECAGIADPLDAAVVDAYWLGGPTLARVRPDRFAEQVADRFRGRTPALEWPWLADKPARGALPHHSFHVLEVLPRIGLLRGGIPSSLVPVLDQCLVRPGRVEAVDGDRLVVRPFQLTLGAGRLGFAEGAGSESVAWRSDGSALITAPAPGDVVALHWGWACARLTPTQAARLVRVTRASVARANATI